MQIIMYQLFSQNQGRIHCPRLIKLPPNVLNKINTLYITPIIMDPRPYHFEYRRPRLSNPTYESSHLYESIYDLKHLTNPYRNPETFVSSNPADETKLARVSSTGISSKNSVDLGEVGMYRYDSKPQGLQKKDKQGDNRSRVASFGMNLVRNSSMDQREVYRRQEKNFNIISCFPKGYEPTLKQFPRLTLEDKLIEHHQDSHFQLH